MARELKEEDIEELDDLCMLSDEKRGRPKKWTEDVIKKFADGLLIYAEQKTSLVLSCYATSKRIDADIYNKLGKISPYFLRALRAAKRIIGERRETGTLLKKLEPKTYSMSQRMYDPEWSKHLDEQLAKDELTKAKAKIKALKTELKNKGEILEYIQSQKAIDTVTD